MGDVLEMEDYDIRWCPKCEKNVLVRTNRHKCSRCGEPVE